MGVEFAFELVLIFRKVGRKNVGHIKILGVHFQPARLRRYVVDVDIAASPAILCECGPACHRDLQSALANSRGPKFAFSDHPVRVYHGGETIRVTFTREPAESRILIRVYYQACDDSACLPKVTKQFELSSRANG